MFASRRSAPVALAMLAVVLAVAMAILPASCSEQTPAGGADLGALIEAMDALYPEGDPRKFSSNPYDYVCGNPAFDSIVAMGYEALPGLDEHLRSNNTGGLRDYLVCVAIETITRCDLKQFEDFAWADSPSFAGGWNHYLERMPSLVAGILEGDMSPRAQAGEIRKLGAPAVPYVVEYADRPDEQHGSEITAALGIMLLDAEPAVTVARFKELNADAVATLRAYVEGR